MSGTGLETLWKTVYAVGSVIHMSTGHTYARAVREHMLISATLSSIFVMNHDDMYDEEQRKKMCSIHNLLVNGDCSTNSVVDETAVKQLVNTVENLMNEEKNKSRAEALWINDMEQVFPLKMILYAERTGDWKLHLHCITRRIRLL